MPLSTTEKASIRAYLGYGSVSLNPINVVDSYLASLTAEGVILVQGYLTQLNIVASLVVVDSADSAGIKSVDNGGVEFFQSGVISERKGLGRTLIKQISIVTQIPIEDDFFGTGGCCGGAGSILNSGAF
jgi:hypothetical protein